ncbi:ABC transporter permease [Aristaeella hokkaidonensis]|uniref:ABC transporter permease n=1 Tax=Aristaeella hokkaidonensis TaxID=3046382 RepID=A0AC61N0J7_9FIRM|nr:ABC transporter permease [Aristaeella hokkaidonensis]QTE70724.1 ABC transporter permease [Clostridiales bacterium FE2011]QUC68503.1 ABC transporter permease [Aristaeella hokkaidonensis]SNT94980.1 simple sugar transport system permease protein [Aristaeella hokkaidonensis]
MSTVKKNEVREPLIHLSKRTSVNPVRAWAIRIAAIALGLIVCGLVAFLLIEKLNAHPEKIGDFYAAFIKGSFSTSRKLWKFLKNIAILLCVSLALTPAFRMRFWNIGGEGQTLVGVLGAIAVDFYLGGKIPEWLLLILMFIAALLTGAVWGVIPALFRAKWGTNETLFTLMMNYVATFLVSYFLVVWVPSGSSSLGKLKYGKLPSIGNDYLLIILVVVALAVALYIYLNYTKHGYEINVVGESVRTAQYVGINEKKVIIRTMILSGALCGLAGYLIAAGLDQTVTTESAGGQGFTGIMVAWLGKFNPLAMILTAGLIQLLNQGAAQISQDFDVSGAFPNVIVGIILFFIIGSEFFINYEIHFRGHHSHAEAGKEAVK